jgi:hypothetical protein
MQPTTYTPIRAHQSTHSTMHVTGVMAITGQLTEPAQVRTALGPEGHPHPVLCATLRTASGQLIKAKQDYPRMCHDQAERAAKRLQVGAHMAIEFELQHAHLCADHATLEPLPEQAAAPCAQQDIFA